MLGLTHRTWIGEVAILIVTSLATFRPTDLQAANLLTNGGFESPGLPANEDYTYLNGQPTLITGWTVTYDGIGEASYYLRNGHASSDAIVYAAEGQYLLSLDDGDSASTTFATVPGQQYLLSYYGLQKGDALQITVGDLNQVELDSDGTPTDISADSIGRFYSLYQADFTATDTTSTLTAYNIEQNDEFGNFQLDGFSVQAVPEPAMFSFLLIGGCLAFLRPRRQKFPI